MLKPVYLRYTTYSVRSSEKYRDTLGRENAFIEINAYRNARYSVSGCTNATVCRLIKFFRVYSVIRDL